MKVHTRIIVTTGMLLALAGSGCGGGDAADDAELAPTADELAAGLLAADDLDGDWAVTAFPDGNGEVDVSGVVTDEMQDQLPGFALCPDASEEAQSTTDDLEWDAFTQLELDTGDPIQPPADRSGHMVFLQQYLAATDADDAAATIEMLRQGATSCLGDFDAGEEGPGNVDAMEVPDLGDDRFGVLMTVEEAGGWAEWRLHHVVVQDGSVLMILVVTDIRAGDGVEPYFTIDDIGDIARTAVGKV